MSGIIASQAFVPNKISGLKLWLDASDISTVSQSGGSVSEWGDKSGGNNATQLTGVSQPTTGTRTISGLNVIDFDGVNDFMNLNSQPIVGPEARTVAIAGFADDDTNQNHILSLSDNPDDVGGRYIVTTEIGIRIDGANRLFPADAVEGGIPAIIILTNEANSNIELDSNNFQIYKNGVLLTGGTSVNPTTPVDTNIGLALICDVAPNGFNGVIGEIVIYDQVLTTFGRINLNTYSGNKWGKFPSVFTQDFSSDFS